LIDAPYRACIFATGLTALVSIVGYARPGTFLRTVSFCGAIEVAYTACDIYAKQEINRAVFRADGLGNPRPFKLWERTKQWTSEDLALFGGATGLLIASNPRLFPGVRGVSRILGVAIVGCAVGAKIADYAFATGPPGQAQRIRWVLEMQRKARYELLASDEKAKAELSRFGRLWLQMNTRQGILTQILGKPPGGSSSTTTSVGVAGDPGHAQKAQMAALREQIKQAHANPPILMVAEFDNEELAAPDCEHGHRQYCVDPADLNEEEMQDHLEHLNRLHESEAKELAYVWQTLVPKEHKMHQLSEEESEKELLRRELQLLNSTALHSQTRLAVISYAQADARKRLAQIRNEEPIAIARHPLPSTQSISFQNNWVETYVPHKTVERIRGRWESVRDDLAQTNALLAEWDKIEEKGQREGWHLSPDTKKKAEQLITTRDALKLNVEATERLLKEFEDRVVKAEEQSSGLR
jgi:hypothetical protein